MAEGTFIWADLSTYDTKKSTAFYSSLFDWHTKDVDGYTMLSSEGSVVAGLYETPAFFKKINMPHFWMSYFQVTDVSELSGFADSLGGKVEINTIPFYNGNISLIRDSMGAGFTVYDGNTLQFSADNANHSIIGTELHTSNMDKSLSFYRGLFNWEFVEDGSHRYQVMINSAASNIYIYELSNAIKGKYEYWTISFQTSNMTELKNHALKLNGSIISEESNRVLITDDSGEAFFYVQQT